MEDNHSVCSGGSQGSISLTKKECPYCKDEFQMRSLFNHIRTKHPREMTTMTNKKYVEDAIKGFPLQIYWTIQNDFDEEEEEKLFVCLSTNKTFKTEERGTRHFNHSPEHKKKHIQHAKMLLKDYKEVKSKHKTKVSPAFQIQQRLVKENNSELARALWRGILFHKQKLELALYMAEKQALDPDAYIAYEFRKSTRTYEQTTWGRLQDKIKYQLEIISLLHRNKCLTCKPLQDIWFDCLSLWSNDLKTSLPHLDFFNSPPQGWLEEKFFYFANEEMEGVDF